MSVSDFKLMSETWAGQRNLPGPSSVNSKIKEPEAYNSKVFIYSVKDAVSKLKNQEWYHRDAVAYVINNDLEGDSQSFHELISLCIEKKDYFYAYLLCQYALLDFKRDFCLTVDLIEISLNTRQPQEKCGAIVDDLFKEKGRFEKYWPRELFIALFDYFDHMTQKYLTEDTYREQYAAKALEIAKDMQERFEGEETGYYNEALLLLHLGERKKAQEFLEHCILDPLNPRQDTKRQLRCPNCCKLWIEEFQDANGSLKRLLDVITKGLKDSATGKDQTTKDFFSEQFRMLKNKQSDLQDYISYNSQKTGVDSKNPGNTEWLKPFEERDNDQSNS